MSAGFDLFDEAPLKAVGKIEELGYVKPLIQISCDEETADILTKTQLSHDACAAVLKMNLLIIWSSSDSGVSNLLMQMNGVHKYSSLS